MPCSFGRCQCGGPFLPQRYVMVILICTAFIIMFVQRVSFTMIVSHMGVATNYSASPCDGESVPEAGGLGEWTEFVQALLLASFFLGYILMLLPAGYIADKFGGRLLCIVSVLSSSVLTILFPLITKYTYFWLVCLGRTIIGAANASVFVTAATFISRWIPRTQWSPVCGATFTSGAFGILLGGMLGAVLEEHITWEAIFYIWGGVGIVWTLCALFWLYSEPRLHPAMTNREIVYLEEEIKKPSGAPFNWIAILVDPCVWGLGAAQFGHSFLTFMLSTNMPYYYVQVLNIDVVENIPFFIAPYIFIWILAVLSGVLADFFIHRKGWRPTLVRKAFYAISVAPVIFIVVIPIIKCTSLGVLLMASFGIAIMGPFFSTLRPNVLEITYNHPGFVSGIVAAFGGISSAIAPCVIDKIVRDNTFKEWGIVSYVTLGVVGITGALYALISNSKRRLWDMTPEEREFYREQKQKDDEARKAAKAAAKK